MVDKIFLDFNKTFERMPCKKILIKMERCG